MASRRSWSVRSRITAVAVVVVAAVLGLGSAGLVWMLDRTVTEHATEQLHTELDTMTDALADLGPAAMDAWVRERDDDVLIALHLRGRVTVNDEDAARLPLPPEEGTALRTTVDDEPVLALSEDVGEGVLVLARSIEDADDAVATTARLLTIAVPVAVALLGVVVWIVTGRALAPVTRMRRQVDAVDAAALDRRVQTTGSGDEIDLLAGTMNRMLERIEHGYRRQQQFVSDASHELRSPLATIRQFAEVTRAHPTAARPDELAQVVLDEGGRMQEIVEGLLLLARLDENVRLTRSVVDLDDLALSEVQRLRALGTASVDGRGIAPVQVSGDARLLARAVRNLVDNAARHARGTIALSTALRSGRAVVQVDDDGAGVPRVDRERIFERFTRLDEARSRDAGGSGLGLAIVHDIVRVHGGAVSVETSPLGGARFTLTLPATPDEG